jgi:beta-N-acetylhexosaminidase
MNIGPLMLDLEGTSLTTEEQELLAHPLVGGVIYFARNYDSPSQIKALSESIRRIRPKILIAVDQEGGRVQRFQTGFTRLPAMQKFLPLYRRNHQAALGLVKDCGWLMASELLAVGVDFSFAPVLDVDDQVCDVIANRSFSPKPEEVVALAGAWMEGMHEAGMATTGKHFPGHGSVTGDSHLQLPVDEREWDAIASGDLIPFAELQIHLDAVMPAHILFPHVDAEQPVGFSQYWLKTLLRGDLNFDGVIFSDDLSMEGAAGVGTFVERANLALIAGCDMVLVCNHRQGALEILNTLSVADRVESNRRLDQMHGREVVESSNLSASTRWQLTQQLLQTLT